MEKGGILSNIPLCDVQKNTVSVVDFHKAKGKNNQLLSLFCGPGGLDEGFRCAGFSTALAIDNDLDCVNTFRLNHPNALANVRDIRSLTVNDLDTIYGSEFHPFAVLGGPPCQSFSVSNVHQSDNDPRNNLPEAYASLLAALNKRYPISFFVFENVPGLLGKRHKHRYAMFKEMFMNAGFQIYEKLLDAKYFGVPQERNRIIIVGINQELNPGCEWIPPEISDKISTVRDTISGLPEPVFNAPGLNPDKFAVHPNHWCLVPRSAKFSSGNCLKEGQMYGRSFRTLYWDKPSWTVAYGHREVHVHPNGHRRLSVYEAMLLQTFPKTYRLTGNMSAQIRLVSEAVPPELAFRLAESIKRSLELQL
ncbi:MAG: DNA cytosine methyltransferase [Armatimonadota bacterium]